MGPISNFRHMDYSPEEKLQHFIKILALSLHPETLATKFSSVEIYQTGVELQKAVPFDGSIGFARHGLTL